MLCLGLSSCIGSDGEYLPPITGRPGDLVVVMDSALWTNTPGRAVMECFNSSQPGLPQREPYFNVIQLERREFKPLFKTTRNIIIVTRSAKKGENKFALKEDLWARGQLVITLVAGRDGDILGILNKNCEFLRNRFRDEEVKRLQRAFKSLSKAKLTSQVEGMAGIRPRIPSDYTTAIEDSDFVWMRKDFDKQGHQVDMGLVFYRKKYTDSNDFNTDNILIMRDEATFKIKGPTKGSFMTYYKEYLPATRELKVRNTYVKEIRGLWHMQGEFMGGPFVHYSFLDPTEQFLIEIDGYVFAPRFDKREYLRELEAIALSAVPEKNGI